jgi:hypothetical protein
MMRLDFVDALRRGEQAYDAQRLRARLFQPVEGGNGRVSGRQHRMQHQHQPFGDILRRLEEIFHGHERARIPMKSDVSDACRRQEFEHAFEKAHAGTDDRRQHQFLAGQDRRLHRREWRLDLDHLQRQVARDLVAQEISDLAEQFAKRLGRAVLVAQQRQLMLHQRMIDDGNAAHDGLQRPAILNNC